MKFLKWTEKNIKQATYKMTRLEFLPEKAKKFIREQIGPEKRKTTITDRAKQKKELEYFCQLVDIQVKKTRKLSLEFIGQDPTTYVKNQTNEEELESIIENYEEDETTQEIQEKIQNKHIQETNKEINIKDIANYFKQKGVIGEDELAIKIFLAASNNMSFGVEGYSGSGKTFIVDKLIDLFDEKDLYRLDLSSKMAVFYDSKNINSYKTIYIPELQKALQETRSPIVEVVKNLTEGKDVKRIVTDYKKKGNQTFKINKGKSIIYTLAAENYFKKDEELNRRFLRFKTKHDEEHLNKILNYKSSKREIITLNDEETLKQDLKTLFNYLRNQNVKILDPYSTYINEFLPRTQKSIGYIDHYFSLIDATTKYNHKNRQELEHKGQKILITDIEDHYLIHKLYYEEFLNTLKEFSKKNNFQEELNIINEVQQKNINWTNATIKGQNIIKQKIPNIKTLNEEKISQYITDIKEKYKFLNSWIIPNNKELRLMILNQSIIFNF